MSKLPSKHREKNRGAEISTSESFSYKLEKAYK